MDKKTNRLLIGCAENVLQGGRDDSIFCPLFKNANKLVIYDSYNGQVSALGVSILMIGLCPTLAVYMQDAPAAAAVNKAYRIYLLEVIARMLEKYKANEYKTIIDLEDSDETWSKYNVIRCKKAYNLTRYIFQLSRNGDSEEEKKVKTDILNCSVALKEVIRTYTLE